MNKECPGGMTDNTLGRSCNALISASSFAISTSTLSMFKTISSLVGKLLVSGEGGASTGKGDGGGTGAGDRVAIGEGDVGE